MAKKSTLDQNKRPSEWEKLTDMAESLNTRTGAGMLSELFSRRNRLQGKAREQLKEMFPGACDASMSRAVTIADSIK